MMKPGYVASASGELPASGGPPPPVSPLPVSCGVDVDEPGVERDDPGVVAGGGAPATRGKSRDTEDARRHDGERLKKETHERVLGDE